MAALVGRHYMAEFFGVDAAGNLVIFRYATCSVTITNATLGVVHLDGRLKVAGLMQKSLFGLNRLRGEMDVHIASLTLRNPDGELDFLRDYSFSGSGNGTGGSGRAIIYEILDPDDAANGISMLTQVFLQQHLLDEDEVVFQGRDIRSDVASTPVLTQRYAGNNSGSPLTGIEGTADDLKGSPKPMVLGQVFNITPKLVNTTKRIYQVTYPNFNSGYTITVYDKRSALTRGTDYTSRSDMETNAPAAGEYRVWPNEGCFRLGSAPVGRVTCDVNNKTLHGLSTVGIADSLYACIVDLMNPLQVLSLSQYLAGSDPTSGIYIDDDRTILDAMQELLAGVTGFLTYGPNPTGATPTLARWFSKLALPNALPYTAGYGAVSLDESALHASSMQQIRADDDERGLPVWRVTVRYRRNYTIMSESDLAGAAAADIEFCKQEWRSVVSEDSSVKVGAPGAREITIDTCLVNITDAQAEADRLLALLKVKRDFYHVQHVPMDALRAGLPSGNAVFLQPGIRINIQKPRFGLSAGKDFLLVGMQEDIDRDACDLYLWG